MKHLTKFLLLALFFSGASQASCFSGLNHPFISGIYMTAFGGINGGYDINCKKFGTIRGYYAGMNIGKNIFSRLRIEEEIIWQGNKVTSFHFGSVELDKVRGYINIWSLMTNLVFDFKFPHPGNPFIGGGIGYTYVHGRGKGELTQMNGNFFIEKQVKSKFLKSGFVWQVIAGLNFPICHNLSISLEYRFFKIGSYISNHKIGLSLAKFF